ncbi:helix-turn-helix domain-containing protein [Nocardia yamanashiensis]|uniref:helix-turn-helix domain-containing protein n=1 Tax=Nocardia yamanashiensis TaxID=209247 RepID=UPI001E40D839|nr:helix-turn-helix domain-containing protein [Nocardia yamanashiensis]UGT42404.1 helix-turn-helix domain-containing protein [Nocardia yamanashiensis]
MSEQAPNQLSIRLSALGSDPSSVLRVIAYFDRLDESAADAAAAVRGAARLAECVVTATWPSGTVIRFDAIGAPVPRHTSASAADSGAQSLAEAHPRHDGEVGAEQGPEPGFPLKAVVADLPGDAAPNRAARAGGGVAVGTATHSPAHLDLGAEPKVWLERRGSEHPLDAVVLDRLRHCLRVVAARQAANGPLRLGDPALLEVVLSEKERAEDRVRAMRLLGLDQAREVRVVAVTGPCAQDAVRMVAERVPVCRVAVIGEITAVLTQDWLDGRAFSDTVNAAIAEAFPASRSGGGGPWMGIGARMPALAAPASWDQACRALRFASSTWHGRRAVAFDRLGSLELLADVPVERLLATPDVLRLNEFAATESGALAVDTLEAFCVYGSLRRTATELHLHHSTVAARIAQVESLMGWDIDEALDRFLATLVLTVRRIALSSAELARER